MLSRNFHPMEVSFFFFIIIIFITSGSGYWTSLRN